MYVNGVYRKKHARATATQPSASCLLASSRNSRARPRFKFRSKVSPSARTKGQHTHLKNCSPVGTCTSSCSIAFMTAGRHLNPSNTSPSAPMSTSAVSVSPDSSVTVGRSRAGCTDSTRAVRNRAPCSLADSARMRRSAVYCRRRARSASASPKHERERRTDAHGSGGSLPQSPRARRPPTRASRRRTPSHLQTDVSATQNARKGVHVHDANNEPWDLIAHFRSRSSIPHR